MNETGRLLRGARLRRGWSQAHLGRIAGCPQSVISAYESGARDPSVSALRKLAGAMDLELALLPRPRPAPDPSVMARQLEEVLGLAEAMHLQPRSSSLRYPVLARPG